jgi:protoheme IX farnesyltransferase
MTFERNAGLDEFEALSPELQQPVASAVAVRSASRKTSALLGAYFQLTKPQVTRLVFVMTLLGAVLAPGKLEWSAFSWAMAGTLLVVASANALNMFLEYDVDALMERTRNRPLPAGLLTRREALVFGSALGALGLLLLQFKVNTLTALLGAFSLFLYVAIYTPMKAKSSLALYVGIIPGAMPPLMGYTGMSHELTREGLALFLVMFVWQVPHFLAITIFRRDDYARAGLQVMSVEYSIAATERAVLWSSLVLLGVTLLPWAVGLGGVLYLSVALVSGFAFCAFAAFGQRGRTVNQWARSVFFASMPYLVALYGALALGA